MKILIAVDSSDFSTEVLDSVAKRTWEPGTLFRLLTVVEPSSEWATTIQFLHQCETILEDRMIQLRKSLPDHNIVGEVAEGMASEVIVEMADQWAADLIILGSHGDTGVRRSRIGSVAAAVVNGAPCSVEIVKIKAKKKTATVQAQTHSAVN